MFRLITICTLFLSVSSAYVGSRSFQLSVFDSRIVGGEKIPITVAPYQISMQYNGQHICGGSIVRERFILTAAHCTNGKAPDNLMVRAGSAINTNGGVLIQVKAIHQHSQYEAHSADYDFSVLELEEPIQPGPTMFPVALAEMNSVVPDGDMLLVSGWGDTKNPDDMWKFLRATSVPKVNEKNCDEKYRSTGGVTDRMICAGYMQGGKDACQGDSGGPLVDSNHTLVGVVSWGIGCAKPDLPGVYARVASVTDWIIEVISK